MNHGISRGWTAWHEKYEARVASRRMLQQAAMRLARPALSGSFAFWRHEWDAALKVVEEEKRLIEEGKMLTKQQQLEQRISELNVEWEAKLAVVAE